VGTPVDLESLGHPWTKDRPTLESVFDYLDQLRESGRTNMYGAASYVEVEMDLPRGQASRCLILWMQTFNRDTTPAERAVAAMAKHKVEP
jgi:hypothetical protein